MHIEFVALQPQIRLREIHITHYLQQLRLLVGVFGRHIIAQSCCCLRKNHDADYSVYNI